MPRVQSLIASDASRSTVIQATAQPALKVSPMELKSEIILTPPRNSATVVLLRDAPAGLEVFLVKRHGLSDVLGGAYVFPGGKLDDSDAQLDEHLHLDLASGSLHGALGEPDLPEAMARGLFVAALRESFEECGVLLASNVSARVTTQAMALMQQGMAFNQILAELTLRLSTSALLPWSRWITPKMASVSSKRFDTRFFVAALPDAQIAHHDDHEATESVWLTPRTALQQYWDRGIELAPPQIMSLAHLSRHSTVDSVLREAKSKLPALVCPEPFDWDGERVLCYPGDERHSVTARALPGPSRLIYRNKRFEPEGGFEALFA
jgi:8-oxo-dGTP pyrophosphatase MutT (NUDIX family)